MSTASDLERAMLDLINADRAAQGLDALTLELDLNAAAEDHSLWMLETDVFSHSGEGGSSPTQRMRTADFDLSGSWGTGENIAIQSIRGAEGLLDDMADLHEALMNSQGHRANILNPRFEHVGLGLELGSFTYSSGATLTSLVVTQKFAYTGGTVSPDIPAPEPEPEPEPVPPAPEPEPTPEPLPPGPAPEPEPIPEPEPLPPAPEPDPEPEQPAPEPMPDPNVPTTGDDRLFGTGGRDRINGLDGDDLIVGRRGSDRLVGGDGDDVIEGGRGHDTIVGGRGADVVDGGAHRDVINGGGGRDLLLGGAGDDVVRGGRGHDTLVGGEGTDTLIGGAGRDMFVFDPAHGGDGDTIVNYRRGKDMVAIDGDLLGIDPGLVDRSWFQFGREAREADTRLLYAVRTGEVRFDVDGAGGAEAELLFTLSGGDRLLIDDILIV
jgi:hypothetical protein